MGHDHAGLAGTVLVDQHDRRQVAGGFPHRLDRQWRGRFLPVAEAGLGQLPRLGRRDVAGQDQDRIVRSIQRAMQLLHVGAGDPRNRSRRTAARMAIGPVAEYTARGGQRSQCGGPAEHQAQIVDGLGLRALQLHGTESRPAHHVGQQTQGQRQLGCGHGDADGTFVPSGSSRQRTAERFGGGGNLRRGLARGTLGQQVRGEVGQAG